MMLSTPKSVSPVSGLWFLITQSSQIEFDCAGTTQPMKATFVPGKLRARNSRNKGHNTDIEHIVDWVTTSFISLELLFLSHLYVYVVD